MPNAAPTPAAERQRVYRARKRNGARFMRGDLSSEAVDALIAGGWIGAGEAGDPAKLAEAVADLIDCWARGTLRPPRRPSVTS